jgi:hypothetical protein
MDLMDPPDQVLFLARLEQATADGKLKWQQGRSEFWLHTRIGRFGYAILSVDEDDYPPYEFRIIVYGANSEEEDQTLLTTWSWDRNGRTPVNDALNSLYQRVKANTLGLSDVVSDMLHDLADLDGGPNTLDDPDAF